MLRCKSQAQILFFDEEVKFLVSAWLSRIRNIIINLSDVSKPYEKSIRREMVWRGEKISDTNNYEPLSSMRHPTVVS